MSLIDPTRHALSRLSDAVWAGTAVGVSAALVVPTGTALALAVGSAVGGAIVGAEMLVGRRDRSTDTGPGVGRIAVRESVFTVVPAALVVLGAISAAEGVTLSAPMLAATLAALALRSVVGRVLEARMRIELGEHASRDELTGLLNRRAIVGSIDRAGRASPTGASPAVLLLDLDGFKGINDLHGHKAGDHVLQTVARRLVAAVDPSDEVARLGGDEFVVLVNQGDPHAVADAIRLSVVEPLDWQRFSLKVGCSVGVCRQSADGVELSGATMLDRADQALYRAKDLGGNVVVDHDLEDPVGDGSAPATRAVKRSARKRAKLGVG